MSPFRVFLAHCDDAGHSFVGALYDLIRSAFQAELADGDLQIFYDAVAPIGSGRPLRPGLTKKLSQSDLVIACSFRRWKQGTVFQQEVKEALRLGIRVVPILVCGENETAEDLGVGSLFPSTNVFLLVPAHPPPDFASLATLLGSHLGGKVIREIRSAIADHASRDLTILANSALLFADLGEQPMTQLSMFLYDGGTTIRRLATEASFLQRVSEAGESLQVRFLYVDTNFRSFVSDTPEFQSFPGISQLNENLYAPLYEALLRKSGMIHSETMGHAIDVTRSIEYLQHLSSKFGFRLAVRRTNQIPYYRMFLAGAYVYYTHLVPAYSAIENQFNAPDYYSLRLSTRSPAGEALKNFFEKLWRNSTMQPRIHAPQTSDPHE